jgi:hypothetical protein
MWKLFGHSLGMNESLQFESLQLINTHLHVHAYTDVCGSQLAWFASIMCCSEEGRNNSEGESIKLGDGLSRGKEELDMPCEISPLPRWWTEPSMHHVCTMYVTQIS